MEASVSVYDKNEQVSLNQFSMKAKKRTELKRIKENLTFRAKAFCHGKTRLIFTNIVYKF